MATIDDAYSLLKYRANQAGISSNITPNEFNQVWQRAELRFFNLEYAQYAANQKISDTISKWMSDPLYINIDTTGRFDFFTGMNLLHIDALNGYLSGTGTAIGSLTSLSGGSGYTDGTYKVFLTGGTGTGATARIIVVGGHATNIQLTNPGTGYSVNDNLHTTGLPLGTGFAVVVGQLNGTTPYQMKRVEKDRLSANLASEYDAPNSEFPIYTQYSSWLQVYPTTTGIAQLVYLQQPTPSLWAYTLNGNIASTGTLVGGSGYTNGTYTNVALTGGSGTLATANITVSGGAVTAVTIVNAGKLYKITDALTAAIPGGSGFTVSVASISNPRPVYSSGTSVQPLWNDYDISQIVDLALQDIAINSRDGELQQFAQGQSKSPQ